MDILTLNRGGSSLKHQLCRWDEKDALASGIVERVTGGKKVKRERKGLAEVVARVPGR